MDNNNSDTNNPSSLNPVSGQPAGIPPADPATTSWGTPVQTDLTQPTPVPAVPSLDQFHVTAPTPNPWDNPSQSLSNTNPAAPMSDPMAPPLQTPPEPPAPPQSPWPSSTSTSGFEAPAAPAQGTPESTDPVAGNPFLQPQSRGTQLSSAPDLGQSAPNSGSPVTGLEYHAPAPPEQTMPNPLQPPSLPLSEDPMRNSFPPAENTQPPIAQETPPPADNFAATDPAAVSSGENLAGSTPAQQGTLDLSALQPGSPTTENPQSQPPVNPLPDMGPQENAPTDLSHLIAGDESHNQPGDIYTPPVAQDQTPEVNPIQTPTAADGTTPPPGKHLNLTKVLLVAGIPIILIVAALSAYLILGIGKPTTSDTTNQTSLPIEQTKQQAPLTNPPQQIVAPSPVSIPVQQSLPESSSSSTVLPGASSSPAASLSPAMQAALKKASPSPNSTTLP